VAGKSNIFAKGLSLHVIVQDAKGISVGDEVLYKGLAIGSVQEAQITSQGISITINIHKKVQIPSDSRFEIKDIGLLGDKAVVITPGKARTFLKNGQTVYGKPEESLLDLAGHGKKLADNLNRFLLHLDSLSGKKNTQTITAAIEQLRILLQNSNQLLESSAPHLQGTLQNLHELTSHNKAAVDSLLQAVGSKSPEIKASLLALNSIGKRTDSLLVRLQRGKGTMGKLMQDDRLYDNLNRMILHLDSLILHIRKNPKKFFEVKVF
jgi:phospholipid/cholesterol/gamma-HCH transport system substrate-binding protein